MQKRMYHSHSYNATDISKYTSLWGSHCLGYLWPCKLNLECWSSTPNSQTSCECSWLKLIDNVFIFVSFPPPKKKPQFFIVAILKSCFLDLERPAATSRQLLLSMKENKTSGGVAFAVVHDLGLWNGQHWPCRLCWTPVISHHCLWWFGPLGNAVQQQGQDREQEGHRDSTRGLDTLTTPRSSAPHFKRAVAGD